MLFNTAARRDVRFLTALFEVLSHGEGSHDVRRIISTSTLLLIVGIALLCFGPRQFTDFRKGLGDGIRNFKSALEQSDATSKRVGSEDKSRSIAKETL